MLLLSKVDADLLQLKDSAVDENVINLYLGNSENGISHGVKNSDDDIRSSFASTVELSNSNHISYHLSMANTVITLYPVEKNLFNKTINLFLPEPTMNQHHTLTIQEFNGCLLINTILQNGIYLLIELPLKYIFSPNERLDHDWFKAFNPYDFTVRVPHLLFSVSPQFLVAFLDDGGLLGLKQLNDTDVEPILFNDNSYLQSITSLFSGRNSHRSEKAVSCILYEQRYLVILTQHCHLRIWDITTFSLVQDYDFSKEHHFENVDISSYENPGRFMSLFSNYLMVYLPFGNGIFEIGTLTPGGRGRINFTSKGVFAANLSSSSIWSLVDMTLLKPLDLNLTYSYANLVVLWKSGTVSKLQILNILDQDLQAHEWIEATNRSLSDIESEQDLNVNSDAEKGLFNLKSRYESRLFERAQKILNENNIIMLPGESELMDYLANLETVLKDLKSKSDEVSSLTIYRDEIILVNSLQKYNHSVYKTNTPLENIYYNIHSELNDDELTRYLKTLHGFSSTISKDVLKDVSERFIGIVSGAVAGNLSPNEKFTDIFKTCLENKFELSNLKLLFNELSSFDIIPTLNEFIENNLEPSVVNPSEFVDSITMDSLATVVTLEGLRQQVTIQRHFVLQILLTFAFLDFDFTAFEKQITSLLDYHFKQSLFLELFNIDKSLLAKELLTRTTDHGCGINLLSYTELHNYLKYALSEFYESPISMSPYFLGFYKSFILESGVSNKQNLLSPKFLLQNVGWPFHVRGNKVQEFLIATILFSCEQYGQAFDYFHLHDYPDTIADSLPDCLKELQDNDSSSIWAPLIFSFTVPYKHSSFEYELSLLFADIGNYEYALKSIKRSIEYSMKDISIDEPHDFKQAQIVQYLDLLFYFDMFAEALDVLRLSPVLSREVKTNYYRSILESTQQSGPFFATLLKLCHSNDKGPLYLPPDDYQIIDKIILSHSRENNWTNLKKLYSFRVVNKHERSAVEALYEYVQKAGYDPETKRKCFLLIINTLSTFDDEQDQWLLNGCNIVTLGELKAELRRL
ncbi:ZYRO0E06666p [Zygosaccharomyces rouxii]|uniref:ZYRO0E06666p n=1 Tax=Zygosaccharomyces rouxii (strain ATCC 2623 / CBS 732 / NBRC 1130 / NCYC 568 / NRRL Y-229) TaxID=559307 RepID=C5E4J6_ZYGRC|nr:uncharacterized protein ZYRO0E06666g [Zygosaccharomyces rouxii]KAH9198186.1 nucleoporin Nup120/160-domain-containing protein [Zygosaccharomyces rouxii]CAR30957.1 ZYRO0E06666p [Zygosaccharomyces rouxii]